MFKPSYNIDFDKNKLSGKTSWKSPSNIALIKYWGKKDLQTPMNPSLSLTLNDCHTITDVSYNCLLYTSPSPRDGLLSRMPSSA